MQNIKVEWVENKTAKTGNSYKKLSVTDEAGKKFDVNIFNSFPDFANVIPGSIVRGKIEQNGQYWNLVSETQANATPRAGGAYKSQEIKAAMDTKRNDINHFQDKKEESIALAGAQRDATLIVTTILNKYGDRTEMSEEDMRKLIVRWRNWFLSEEFKTPPPF